MMGVTQDYTRRSALGTLTVLLIVVACIDTHTAVAAVSTPHSPSPRQRAMPPMTRFWSRFRPPRMPKRRVGARGPEGCVSTAIRMAMADGRDLGKSAVPDCACSYSHRDWVTYAGSGSVVRRHGRPQPGNLRGSTCSSLLRAAPVIPPNAADLARGLLKTASATRAPPRSLLARPGVGRRESTAPVGPVGWLSRVGDGW
jgi:hypothetical protein